jgi:hypothetical protein
LLCDPSLSGLMSTACKMDTPRSDFDEEKSYPQKTA